MINVVMAVYNQEKYVKKAIDSILMQNDAPDYKIIISDDCSTDNTYQICCEYQLKYPERIKLIKNTSNQGLIKNYINCFKNCDSEFIAILEGDDYWIDLYKLKKQYDVLINNPKIGLVHTCYKILNQEQNRITILSQALKKRLFEFHGEAFLKIYFHNHICAPTVMFRSDVFHFIDLEDILLYNFKTIDLLLWLECSLKYEIVYLDDITSVYRVHKKSVSNNRSFINIENWILSQMEIKKYIISKYRLPVFYYELAERKLKAKLSLICLKNLKIKKSFFYARGTNYSDWIRIYSDWKLYN